VAASRVLAAAAVEARRLGSDAVGAEHILLSLLQEEPTTALLDALGIAPATAAERLASGSRRPRTRGGDDAPAERELAYTSHARRLLDSTEAVLSDVADSAGFADQAHFTRMFKREFGVTPGALQRVRRLVPAVRDT
jgi:AraC family transcriptional regulator